MILIRLFGLFLDLLLLPLRLLRRRRLVRPGAWLELTIDGGLADVVAKPRFWQLRRDKKLSLHWLDEVVTTIAREPRVKGLLVTIHAIDGGMASATSLRQILARARAAGKEVVVHLPLGGATKEVYVASAASKTLLGPVAQLAPLGFQSSTRYVKRALEHAGIEPQVFAVGEFKSAGETLVREEMSPAQRAQIERLLDGFQRTLIDALAEGRGVDAERARAIVDAAPYFGEAAITAGLADGLAYEDEVPKRLGCERRDLVSAATYLARAKRPLLRRLRRPPTIAVVPIHGAIAHRRGPIGNLVTDEDVTRMVRAVRSDARVHGVVIHVDSPGGSALASDRMHHEIVQLAREKPVVVCMANTAASGGYYVAASAACIVAQPTTITGSIGVVAARLSIDPLLARLGIRTEIISRGAHASLLSPLGSLDEDTKQALMRELEATYRAFVGVVASGRELPEADVERLARGRVYTGTDAHDVGLVDVLGGFDAAVRELRDRLPAGVRDAAEVALVRPSRSAREILDLPRDEAPAKTARALLGALLSDRERVLVDLAGGGDRVLLLSSVTDP